MNELPTPPDAATVELLRVWIVGETLQCSLQPDAFPDAGSWGAVLADVVRHVAEAFREQDGTDEEKTIKRILEVFQEELRTPSAE